MGWGAFKKFKYLGKIETEFENTLACLLGAWMSSNHEKRGRKPRDTIPLMSQTAFVSPEPHARISCTKFNTQVILFPSNMTLTYSVQIYMCVVGTEL